MSNDTRTTLDAWLRQLTNGAVCLDEHNVAAIMRDASSLPLYVLYPGGSGEVYILAAQIDTLPRDCPREVLAQLLALNNQPALAPGAFGVNGEDGTLTYRYFGEMAGMDFPGFRNTVANFCILAERAHAEYRKLAFTAPAPARKPMLAAQRAV
ncbi:hypothetical protein ACXIUT_06920 [Achromobacter denitrificans]